MCLSLFLLEVFPFIQCPSGSDTRLATTDEVGSILGPVSMKGLRLSLVLGLNVDYLKFKLLSQLSFVFNLYSQKAT